MATQTLSVTTEIGNATIVDRRMLMSGAVTGGALSLLPVPANSSTADADLLAVFQEWSSIERAYQIFYGEVDYLDTEHFPHYARREELQDWLGEATPVSPLGIAIKAATAQIWCSDDIGGPYADQACQDAVTVLENAGLLPEPIQFTDAEIAELHRLDKLEGQRIEERRRQVEAEKQKEAEGTQQSNALPPTQEDALVGPDLLMRFARSLSPWQKEQALTLIQREMGSLI